MSKPTLLVKGHILPDVDPKKKVLASAKAGSTVDTPDEKKNAILPLDYIMNRVDRGMGKAGRNPADKILVLNASVGSGKSTTIPPEIFHKYFASLHKNVACTQPRVFTATEIPNTIIKFHSREALNDAGLSHRTPLKLGENIGFQTGVLSNKPVRGIIYMTVGVMTQQLCVMTDDEICIRYMAIIIDEAHERSAEADTAMRDVKAFIHRNYTRSDCPVLIVMSATFDYVAMSKYLDAGDVIRIAGFTFPVDDHYLPYDAVDWYASALEQIITIHKSNIDDFDPKYAKRSGLLKADAEKYQKFRDILVFVPGLKEMTTLMMAIQSSKDPSLIEHPVLVCQLDRSVVNKQGYEFRQIYTPWGDLPGKPTRRVIIATNVGETGITIDTLKYVIDSGWYKSAEYNPDYDCGYLASRAVTKGMMKQRKGRVGRISPGQAFSLYSEETAKAMIENQYPDMLKNNVEPNLLNVAMSVCRVEEALVGPNAASAKKNVKHLNLLQTLEGLPTPPSIEAVNRGCEKLRCIGFLDKDLKITKLGKVGAAIRFITPEAAAMIIYGSVFGMCMIDLIDMTIAVQFDVQRMVVDNSALRALSIAEKQVEKKSVKKGSAEKKTKESEISTDDILKTLDDVIENEIVKLRLDMWLQEDDFITSMLLYQINKESPLMDELSAARDELISNLALAGLDPFQNHEESFVDFLLNSLSEPLTLRDGIESLKRCVYEGYKYHSVINGKSIHGDIAVMKSGKMPIPIISSAYVYEALTYRNGSFTANKICSMHNSEQWIGIDPYSF